MKVLYYDCFSGISGDMNLGALIDLGIEVNYVKNELKKLNINEEFQLIVSKEEKQGISGIRAEVKLSCGDMLCTDILEHEHNHEYKQNHNHKHEHSHKLHIHRSYKDIKDMIGLSELNDNTKRLAIDIFDKVAEAEAKVHNKSIEEVHFHEVGAVDSIIDIVGAAICIDFLKPDLIISSPIEVGYGTVKCQHGILPVPAPATAEILKGVPIMAKKVPFEATTPTGAAIVKGICTKFTFEKNFIIEKIGYGLGKKEGVGTPNVLRVIWGNIEEVKDREFVIECNCDDMRGEEYELLMERLFEAGAYDVYFTPIIMKKQRPATKISIICSEEKLEEIKHCIFKNSSTIGIRQYEVTREKLNRKIENVECKYGSIPVKVCFYQGEVIRIKPEYDTCKRIAKEKCLSINEVYTEVINQYRNFN